MSETLIPDSEVLWLYGLDEKYKIKTPDGKGSVYPVDLLPPKLRAFVKRQSYYLDFIHIAPARGSEDYTYCRIWGWNVLPTKFEVADADWSTTFKRKMDPPTMDDLQNKIEHIQSELKSLSGLLTQYKGGS